ncbi:hypothetical protein ACQ4PT_020031 [Festuca glaucescens]
MALPDGAVRDHPWCNLLSPGAPRLETLPLPPMLVCVAEVGILHDRNLELCRAREVRGAGHVRRRRARLPGAPQIPPIPAADAGDAGAHQGLRQR